MKSALRRLGLLTPLRRLFLPIFAIFNPGDITIRHHFTGAPFCLHSFRHKGYWFYGEQRESETMRFFAEFIAAGDTVLEIGGHIGYISVYLSMLVGARGKLIVLEPGENNLPYLKRNTRNYPNVSVIEKGAADFNGELTFYMENLTGQNDSFVKDYEVLQGNARNARRKPAIVETRVPVVTIDGLIKADSLRPAFIKIDVEGFEYQVLKGMTETLSVMRPGLMIEVTRQPRQVFAILQDHGYLCYDRFRNKVLDSAEMSDNIFCVHPEAHRDRKIRLDLEF